MRKAEGWMSKGKKGSGRKWKSLKRRIENGNQEWERKKTGEEKDENARRK